MPLPAASRRANFLPAFRFVPLGFCAVVVLLFALPLLVHSQSKQKKKLPHPRKLDAGVVWRRDPSTGELTAGLTGDGAPAGTPNPGQPHPPPIHVATEFVPVTCSVADAGGGALAGLTRENFRVYDDGAAQTITYFDASTQPATVALVIDASPSVLRESEEMKDAARALVDALSPTDQVAVVDFSAHTYLQLPFSTDWGLIREAVARVDARQLLGDTGGSNIYQSVFLAARKLFAGRTGRKAIVLLTDGQDSGLGLTLDPATASLQPGWPRDRLTFDDVARTLGAADIQVFAVSTEGRPKIMTADWLAAHSSDTLLTTTARKWDIPAYTLYLAELVRRSGGQLYFLRETETLADTFRQVARKIRAEYTLGFTPGGIADATAAPRAGWHSLRVEVLGHGDATAEHRASYYVPAAK
jgi:Ca-activated chloride channel family protein